MYLLDSDVARKLSQYTLVCELAVGLNCSMSEFAVLPQLKYQLKLNAPAKALEKLGTIEAVKAATELIESASEVEVTQDAANPILELNRPDIDAGEQILLAALHCAPNGSLISGDKRAFVAISKVNEVPALEPLWARIICLEEAIFLLIKEHNFANISSKIRSRTDADKNLNMIFGLSQPNSYDSVIEGLVSSMRSLKRDTGGYYCLPCELSDEIIEA